jgi:hypothetical protein
MIPNYKFFMNIQKNPAVYPGISRYKRRNYNNNFGNEKSKNFFFSPEFLEKIKTQNEKKKNLAEKNFNNYWERLCSVPIFLFFSKFFLLFIPSSNRTHQFVFFFFWEKYISVLIIYIIVYLSFSLFSQKIRGSKCYDSMAISSLFFWIITKIELFFFLNEKFLVSFTMSLISFFGVYFSLWEKFSVKKDIVLSYSIKMLLYRETRVFLTSLSLFKILMNTKILFCEYAPNLRNFSSFFVDLSTILTLEKCFFFSKSFLKFKTGGNFISILSTLYFVYCITFSYKTPFKKFYFFAKKFWPLENFSYFNYENLQKNSKVKNSLFLRSEKKNSYLPQKNFEEKYFQNNFSKTNSSKRWKIKKNGIVVPFPYSIWQSELPFRKKSLAWNIKKKDI